MKDQSRAYKNIRSLVHRQRIIIDLRRQRVRQELLGGNLKAFDKILHELNQKLDQAILTRIQ